MEEILEAIRAERKRQDDKWGQQDHSTFKWCTILGEEFGEACKEAFEGNSPNYIKELTEVAAVAVAAIESANRNKYTSETHVLNFFHGRKRDTPSGSYNDYIKKSGQFVVAGNRKFTPIEIKSEDGRIYWVDKAELEEFESRGIRIIQDIDLLWYVCGSTSPMSGSAEGSQSSPVDGYEVYYICKKSKNI